MNELRRGIFVHPLPSVFAPWHRRRLFCPDAARAISSPQGLARRLVIMMMMLMMRALDPQARGPLQPALRCAALHWHCAAPQCRRSKCLHSRLLFVVVLDYRHGSGGPSYSRRLQIAEDELTSCTPSPQFSLAAGQLPGPQRALLLSHAPGPG